MRRCYAGIAIVDGGDVVARRSPYCDARGAGQRLQRPHREGALAPEAGQLVADPPVQLRRRRIQAGDDFAPLAGPRELRRGHLRGDAPAAELRVDAHRRHPGHRHRPAAVELAERPDPREPGNLAVLDCDQAAVQRSRALDEAVAVVARPVERPVQQRPDQPQLVLARRFPDLHRSERNLGPTWPPPHFPFRTTSTPSATASSTPSSPGCASHPSRPSPTMPLMSAPRLSSPPTSCGPPDWRTWPSWRRRARPRATATGCTPAGMPPSFSSTPTTMGSPSTRWPSGPPRRSSRSSSTGSAGPGARSTTRVRPSTRSRPLVAC